MNKNSTSGKRTGLEIAVIGMAGRFPGAANIDEFWDNLVKGKETVSFLTDEELEKLNPALRNDPKFVKAKGGVLADKDCFDAYFFDYTPLEAEIMDPQVRIFYECCWAALENAGYDPFAYNGLIGLYAGNSLNFYWEGMVLLSGKSSEYGIFASGQLTNRDFLTTHVSYKFDLQGPSFLVQSACSTSLVAIHVGCRALLTGECKIALCGGVTLSHSPKSGYFYQEGMIASSDGHCRPFDADASGAVFGEGVGVVVLKPIKDAIADRDYIYAVVKGTAINNDGIRKVGFSAPSVNGQTEVIRAAVRFGRVDPESIAYVETHGTGTALGDPIEVEALSKAFNTDKKGYCGIGSVKANVSHLDAAAGITGFIKTVLVLKNRLIPPAINFKRPNPRIDFENSPFYVVTKLTEWQPGNLPGAGEIMRAGVSSLGIGGTNAHAILEEFPHAPVPVKNSDREYKLVLLSAKTSPALEKATVNMAVFLRDNPGINLSDAAYTLQVGRISLPHRRMLVCSQVDEAVAALTDPNSEKVHSFTVKNEDREVIFMFPGQGSQYVNMALELYQKEIIFRDEMDRCFEILKPLMDYDLRQVLYPGLSQPLEPGSPAGGPGVVPKEPGLLAQTEITQPIIFMVEYALARLLLKWGIKPKAMIGHSIGEYTAACLSGVFSLKDALKLVVLRGKLMQRMAAGAMLSVPLPEEELTPMLNDELSLAAVNSTAYCVVSGPGEAVDIFAKQLGEMGHETRSLHTSHAFHSRMMDPVLKEFEEAVTRVVTGKPEIPYLSNVTGKWLTAEEVSEPAYWTKQLRRTVRFADGLSELLTGDNLIFVEVGPGRNLSTFVRQHRDKKPGQININLLRHPSEETSDTYFLLRKIGRLWLAGVKIDWQAFYSKEQRYRAPLPTYPFERHRFRIDSDSLSAGVELFSRKSLAKKPDITDWFYMPTWTRLFPLTGRKEKIRGTFNWLVFSDERGLGQRLVRELGEAGQFVVEVKTGAEFAAENETLYSINPGREKDYDSLIGRLAEDDKVPDRIIHLWGVGSEEVNPGTNQWLDSIQDRGLYSLLFLVKALGNRDWQDNIHIEVATGNMQAVGGETFLSPWKSTVLGAVKVIPLEYDNIKCCSVDIEVPKSGSTEETNIVNQLLAEFAWEFPEQDIAYRDSFRWVQRFEPIRLEKAGKGESVLRDRGVYLIIGGLGGIGLNLAKCLAESVSPRLVLTSLSPFPHRQEWKNLLDSCDEGDITAERIRFVMELEELGAEVLTCSLDIANRNQLQEVKNLTEECFGPINGVIHAGGIPGGGAMQLQNREKIEDVLRSKVRSMLFLDQIFEEKALDFMILCSSASTILPGFGEVDYVAANAFLDNFAYYNTLYRGTYTTAVNWGRWSNIGMARETENKHKKMTEEESNVAITTKEGIEAFRRILSDNRLFRIVVIERDLDLMIEQYLAKETGPEAEVTKPETSTQPVFDRPDLSSQYVPPGNRTEQVLAGIWQRFFGFDRVGIVDDFFELGGDSLKATVLVSNIHKELHVKLPLATVFQTPTIKKLAEYIDAAAEEKFVSISPVEKKECYAMSSAQKRVYLLQRKDPETTAFNLNMVIPLQEGTQLDKIEAVFRELILRHESLRTSFENVKDEPMQRVHDPGDIKFKIECQNVAADEVPEGNRFIRPFDLSRAPLLRVELIRYPNRRSALLVDMHHSIADGVSHDVLKKDFEVLYSGRLLPGLKIQYKDFSEWQNGLSRDTTERETIRKQERYWVKEFRDKVPRFNMPIDFERPRIRKIEGASLPFEIGSDVTKDLRRIAREEETTMFMLLLALYYVFLARISSQEDIVVGSPTAGRSHADLEQVIGMFVNFLPLRSSPASGKCFKEFLSEVKQKAVAAFENGDYHFENLVEKLKLERDPARTPLFEVIFSFHSTAAGSNRAAKSYRDPGAEKSEKKTADQQPAAHRFKQSNYDLMLHCRETEEKIYFIFEYGRRLFKKETIEKFILYLKEVTINVAKDPDLKLSEIEIVSHEEKAKMLEKLREKRGIVYEPGKIKDEGRNEKIAAEFDF